MLFHDAAHMRVVNGHTLRYEAGSLVQLLCRGDAGGIVDADMHRARTRKACYGSYNFGFGAVNILPSKPRMHFDCTRCAVGVAE